MSLTTVQPGMLGTPQPYNFKNRLINGGMVFDQRNNGVVTTPNNGAYTLDRWSSWQSTGSTFSVQQVSDGPTGFTKSLKVTILNARSPSGSDYYLQQQIIEGVNCSDLAWGTVNAKAIVLSFWVKCSVAGTYGGTIFDGTGAASYAFTYTVSATSTWEQKTVAISGPSIGTWPTDNTASINISFGLGMGTTYTAPSNNSWISGSYRTGTGSANIVSTAGATWQLTGVQFEVGVSATTFDYRPYTTEQMLCYRYYWRINSNNYFFNCLYYAPNSVYTILIYPVPMRAAPTSAIVSGSNYYVVYTNSTSDYLNNWVLEGATTQTTALKNETESSGTGGYSGICALQNAAGFIALTAEL